MQFGTATAISAVALPHALATVVRGWRLRRAIDWEVLRRFGLLSAVGGLAGALLYAELGGRELTLILGVLLVLTAIAGLTGWTSRVRPRGPAPWLLGLASGLFGGLAGNQGGLRSAALLSFGLGPAAFIATTTATGVLVDLARTPIYLWRAGGTLLAIAPVIAIASVGVLAGTFAGERILLGLSPRRFRLGVSAFIGLLGLWLVATAVSWPVLAGHGNYL